MWFQYTTLVSLTLASLSLGAEHEIEVGEEGLTFTPRTVTAKQGDIIVFKLYPGHDVVQSSFSSPCQPSSNGFFSGSYSDTNNGELKFVVQVNGTDPIYFYCSVASHCQSGMVGGINVP